MLKKIIIFVLSVLIFLIIVSFLILNFVNKKYLKKFIPEEIIIVKNIFSDQTTTNTITQGPRNFLEYEFHHSGQETQFYFSVF